MSPTLPFDPIAAARKHWQDHGWGDAADGMSAVTSIMRAQQIVLQRVDATLKPYDITFARYEVLMLLTFSRSGSLPMNKISERLQVHPTSVTNAVARLESAGLVTRRQNPVAGRARLVGLTVRGRRIALKATDDLNEHVFGAVGLAPSRLSSLTSTLGALRRNAGDFA